MAGKRRRGRSACKKAREAVKGSPRPSLVGLFPIVCPTCLTRHAGGQPDRAAAIPRRSTVRHRRYSSPSRDFRSPCQKPSYDVDLTRLSRFAGPDANHGRSAPASAQSCHQAVRLRKFEWPVPPDSRRETRGSLTGFGKQRAPPDGAPAFGPNQNRFPQSLEARHRRGHMGDRIRRSLLRTGVYRASGEYRGCAASWPAATARDW